MKQFAARTPAAIERRPMPKMMNLERNQRRGREDHEKFRPALLQINARPFGEQNRRIKERDQAGDPQLPARDHVLQPIEQIERRPAVHERQFIARPVADFLQPLRAAVQKKQRNSDTEEEQRPSGS